MPIEREYLSPNEIAELLGVSPFTIRRYIKLGELRAVKLLGGFRVHRDNLNRFLKAHEVNPEEEDLAPEEAVAEDPLAVSRKNESARVPVAEIIEEESAKPARRLARKPVPRPRTRTRPHRNRVNT